MRPLVVALAAVAAMATAVAAPTFAAADDWYSFATAETCEPVDGHVLCVRVTIFTSADCWTYWPSGIRCIPKAHGEAVAWSPEGLPVAVRMDGTVACRDGDCPRPDATPFSCEWSTLTGARAECSAGEHGPSAWAQSGCLSLTALGEATAVARFATNAPGVEVVVPLVNAVAAASSDHAGAVCM